MPLPFILAGAAAIAGGYGVKKGLDAKSDLDSANSINRSAKRIFDEAHSNLESVRSETQEVMSSLGELKFKIYQESMIPFAETFKQIKKIDFKDSNLTDGNLVTSEQQLEAITSSVLEMEELVSGGVASLGTGGLAGLAAYGGVGLLGTASTGTAIGTLSGAAATNATLAWLGGGSLAAGGYGMAGGMAVLGGLVAGPALAVGGMMFASQAETAKEDARANMHQAEVAAEEKKTAVVATNGIKARCLEVNNVLAELNGRFEPLLQGLKALVAENQHYPSYSIEDQKGVHFCASLAKTIKNLLETPLLSDSGALTSESASILNIADKTVQGIDAGKGCELFKEMGDASNEEEVVKETAPSKQCLSDFLRRHYDFLNDGSSVYCSFELFSSKAVKKIENAIQSYAHAEWQTDNDDKYDSLDLLQVFIDTTVFGSGKEGFYITEDEIAAKPFLGERFYIKLKDIRRIKIDEDERNILINGEELTYIHSSLTSRMKIIVDAIDKYIKQ